MWTQPCVFGDFSGNCWCTFSCSRRHFVSLEGLDLTKDALKKKKKKCLVLYGLFMSEKTVSGASCPAKRRNQRSRRGSRPALEAEEKSRWAVSPPPPSRSVHGERRPRARPSAPTPLTAGGGVRVEGGWHGPRGPALQCHGLSWKAGKPTRGERGWGVFHGTPGLPLSWT